MSGYIEQGEAAMPACAAAPSLPGRRLGELVLPVAGGDDELLRHRFLCRKGSLLLIAGTGFGKSVMVLQLGMCWSVGKGFAGIEPARPLRVWIVQGENCEGDIAEQRDGILWGLRQAGTLTPEECDATGTRVRVLTETHHAGHDFGEWLREALQAAREAGELPDLVIIDPAFCFLGGDASSQADVSVFLRNILNPLLDDFDVGLLLVHHGNKPIMAGHRRERSVFDLVYAGAGSAEWCNWARSTLFLEQTATRGLFVLHAGKNGHKLQWRNPVTGERLYERHLAHAADGRIYWREPAAAEIEAASAGTSPSPASGRRSTVEDVVRLASEPLGKADLEDRVRSGLGIGRDAARGLIRAAVERGLLQEARVNVFPARTLVGPPGATAAEAERQSAERDGAGAPAGAGRAPAAGAAPPSAAEGTERPDQAP